MVSSTNIISVARAQNGISPKPERTRRLRGARSKRGNVKFGEIRTEGAEMGVYGEADGPCHR